MTPEAARGRSLATIVEERGKAMAFMLAKLYTALREAGADDDNTREAAEVASFENRLAHVEASLKRNNM